MTMDFKNAFDFQLYSSFRAENTNIIKETSFIMGLFIPNANVPSESKFLRRFCYSLSSEFYRPLKKLL